MQLIRNWSVKHSRGLEYIYLLFEPVLIRLHKVWNVIGYERLEKPVRVIEKSIKGLMFDCQMCGQCALSSSGMSCSMNCPKSLRNGPCGGVRMDGTCEVKPEMRCVWVEAWKGAQQMSQCEKMKEIQQPVNYSFKGSSSWLRVVQDDVKNKQEMPDDVRIKR
ncbi:MAG: hypothetical protein GY744_14800 [Gammaproteobacteria bacterium]|nr:hypothetical protein [Gammaproteobacteria bacterium]